MAKISECTTVLLIDMQYNFLDYVYDDVKESLIYSQVKVINYCALKDIPLVILEYAPRLFGKTNRRLSEAAKSVQRKVLLEKNTRSGFNDTNLEEVLHYFEGKNLYLMGIFTDQCVQKTAEDAVKRGFRVSISEDVTNCVGIKKPMRWFRFPAVYVYAKTYLEMIEIMENG